MKIFNSLSEWIKYRHENNVSLGFVPTMGALHEGHLTLVRQALNENSKCVVSIFVNPTQFNNSNDLKSYPTDLEKDINLLEQIGTNFLLLPNYNEIYPDSYRYQVSEKDFSKKLCGKHRPGHFDGVLTIVLKLLNIVRAENAYFGKKDFQQYTLIKDMVKAFFIPTKIIGVDTVREKDGLAMSSRNLRLNQEDRQKANLIFKSISQSKSAKEAYAQLEDLGFNVDYCEDLLNHRFVAANIGDVRLIDNVEL